jgi:hypothetical protein
MFVSCNIAFGWAYFEPVLLRHQRRQFPRSLVRRRSVQISEACEDPPVFFTQQSLADWAGSAVVFGTHRPVRRFANEGRVGFGPALNAQRLAL